MIDRILKAVFTPRNIAMMTMALDGLVQGKTGKHIHEHAIDFVKSLWKRLTSWAKRYLAENATARKVYLSAVSIAAAAKRARNAGAKIVKVKLFGLKVRETRGIVIHEEDVPLGQIDGVIEQAKTAPVLAMRN